MRYSFDITDYSLPLYIDSLSNRWKQENVDRKSGYPYVHWLQSISGTGVISIDGTQELLHPGQGILIDRDIPHEYYGCEEEWITAYFTFGGELITELLATLGIRKFIKIDEPDQMLMGFVDECYKRIQKNDVESYETSVMVYKLLILIKKNQIKSRLNDRLMDEIVNPIIDFIKTNYRYNLKNQDFVKQTNYSLQYILEVFKEGFDSSPHKLLADYRVRKAKELLVKSTDMSVEEIGKSVGFNTNSYFIKVFKERERMTPGKFREQML